MLLLPILLLCIYETFAAFPPCLDAHTSIRVNSCADYDYHYGCTRIYEFAFDNTTNWVTTVPKVCDDDFLNSDDCYAVAGGDCTPPCMHKTPTPYGKTCGYYKSRSSCVGGYQYGPDGKFWCAWIGPLNTCINGGVACI